MIQAIQSAQDQAEQLRGKLKFNLNGSGRRSRQAKNRDLLVNELLSLGWTVLHDGSNDEVTFAKHLKSVKCRSILQLLSSPSFGTGLYIFALRQHTFDIRAVYTEFGRQLKLSCYDFDAYPVSAMEFATEEEMGRDRFLRFLMDQDFITEEDLKYFDRSEMKRRKLARGMPTVIMDIVKEVPRFEH